MICTKDTSSCAPKQDQCFTHKALQRPRVMKLIFKVNCCREVVTWNKHINQVTESRRRVVSVPSAPVTESRRRVVSVSSAPVSYKAYFKANCCREVVTWNNHINQVTESRRRDVSVSSAPVSYKVCFKANCCRKVVTWNNHINQVTESRRRVVSVPSAPLTAAEKLSLGIITLTSDGVSPPRHVVSVPSAPERYKAYF
ncbi:hypothetical protein J6590_078961 [Homalodisca vitripennis]|nr:hypothetical protein J6590_078961 [Homalodisca vitripennis]